MFKHTFKHNWLSLNFNNHYRANQEELVTGDDHFELLIPH